MEFTFVYKNCKTCHEETYSEDLINNCCQQCFKCPIKKYKFKCYPCSMDFKTPREYRQHLNDTQHKKNYNFLKEWLFT